jgi:hypothetical protein
VNLGELRQKVADLRSRHISGDTFASEFRRSVVAPALKQLASDVPEAFIPDEETIIIYKDYTSTTMNRTVSATSDPYVLDLGPANLVGATPIVTDGTWDCVYYLEITLSSGELVRRRCREFFTVNVNTDIYAYVSIDRPWPNNTDKFLQFRLYQPYFYTRDDVTAIVDGRVYDSTQQVLFTVPAGAMRIFSQEDYNGTVTGRPERLSRWGHEQLPAPNRTPIANAPNQDPPVPWLGPEPPGTFKYRYTYVWGRKDEDLTAPGGKKDPMLESSPSPESSAVVMTNANDAVVVSAMVNIDYIQNFDPSPSAIRNTHSGWRKRIYRARSAIVPTGGMQNNIEYPEDVYFFLDEVDGAITTYVDNGSVTPDYNRRMPESHGYFRWALHPHQNDQYTVDFRVYRRPLPLLNDSDAPQVHPDYEDMLLLLCLKHAAMLDKQPAEAQDYERQFLDKLAKWRGKDANPSSVIVPVPWTMVDYADWYRYGPFKSVVP